MDGRGRSGGRGRGGRGRGGRNGGGRGRGAGRGGGGGRGRGGGGGGGRGMSREERKAGRRQKQLQAMEKKAAEEDAYFRECQIQAQNQKKKTGKQPQHTKDDTSPKTEQELFGKQMVKGINFEKYNEIKVEVKVPENKQAAAAATTPPPEMDDFSKLKHLTPRLKKNIALMKYTQPTPIQKNAIPLAMAGEDLMCCAQTGSGKTCAFLLPVVAALVGHQNQQGKGNNKKNNQKNQGTKANDNNKLEPAKPKCVVLAPTRELASQIELEAQKLSHAIPTLQPVVVYGGANPRGQLKELAIASGSGNDLIVVATPGRLTDFVDRNLVSLSDVEYLVLDEADRCLDMGFEPQIRKLVQQSGMTPKEKRQTFLFSATFPPAIQTLAAEFLREYVWIAIGRVGSTTDSITQVLIKSQPDKRSKLELVVEALEKGPKGRTLIFVQKKKTANWLKKQLKKGGPDAGPRFGGGPPNDKQQQRRQPYQGKEIIFKPISAEEIHGDRSQAQREAALEKFRSGQCKVLVATDVAARGLDIPGVEHVINMDLPNAQDDFDSYVHRIGRTGRAGNEGLATSLFVPGDNPKLCNGRIAGLLLAQLKESKQEVPSWLEDLVPGAGGGDTNKKQQQFTSTDVRKNTTRPSNNNNNNNKANVNKTNGNQTNAGEGRGGRGRGRGGRGRGRGRESGPDSAGQESSNGKKEENQNHNEKSDEGGRGSRGGGGGRGGRARGRGGRGRGGKGGRGGGVPSPKPQPPSNSEPIEW